MRWLLVAMMLATSTADAAGIYRWTDAAGNVVFGDSPPQQAVGTATLVPSVAPTRPDAALVDRLDAQQRYLRAREVERQQATEAHAAAAKQAGERKAACLQALAQLQQLRDARQAYRRDKQGNRTYLSDAERSRATDARAAQLQRNCPGMSAPDQ